MKRYAKKYSIEPIEGEVWKPIPDLHGYYEASNKSRIKRVTMVRDDGRLFYEKLLKPIKSSCGYWESAFAVKGVRRKFLWHRVLAMTFIQNPENKPQVNHKNGNRADCRLENLEWVTAFENNKHKVDVLGNSTRGENGGKAKLTENDVHDIFEKRQRGETYAAIAREYGVLDSTIFKIIKGVNWKYLKLISDKK